MSFFASFQVFVKRVCRKAFSAAFIRQHLYGTFWNGAVYPHLYQLSLFQQRQGKGFGNKTESKIIFDKWQHKA